MKKQILYIDMDGVVADFDKAIKMHCPDLHTGDNFPDYESRSKQVYKICGSSPRIFLDLEPIEGAIPRVHALSFHYEIYFLSTPMWSVPESYTDKRLWLEKHFGGWSTNRLILTNRKDLMIGDYLVDDRLRNGAGEFKGKHIHFRQEEFPNWEAVDIFLMSKLTN